MKLCQLNCCIRKQLSKAICLKVSEDTSKSCFLKTHLSWIGRFVVGQIDSFFQESINRTCQMNWVKRDKI